MKNVLSMGMVILLAVSLASFGFAQEKAKSEQPAGIAAPGTEKSTEMAKPEGKMEEKQPVVQPEMVRMGGLVTEVDAQKHILAFHQETIHHDRVVNLKVSEKAAQELSNLKPGDVVNVWVTGGTVTALHRVG